MLETLYEVQEVAERYKTTKDRVWEWIRNHKLNAIKVGKKDLVPETALVEFEEKNKMF